MKSTSNIIGGFSFSKSILLLTYCFLGHCPVLHHTTSAEHEMTSRPFLIYLTNLELQSLLSHCRLGSDAAKQNPTHDASYIILHSSDYIFNISFGAAVICNF